MMEDSCLSNITSLEAMDSTMEIKTSYPNSRWWSQDTIAVVTGANRGIGFALVKQLADLGLTVVLTARDVAKGQAAADSLTAQDLRVEFCQLDIAVAESISAFAAWLWERFRGLDILVNNAGVSFNDINTNLVDRAEEVIRTNFHGPKLLIQALLPMFRRSATTSRILNVSSRLGAPTHLRNPALKAVINGDSNSKTQLTYAFIENMVARFLDGVKRGTWEEEGWPKVWTVYAVSKLALNIYSRLLAGRLEGSRISINCYCPGFTRTDMTGGVGSHSAEEAAEFGVQLIMTHPTKLPTGKFIKLSGKRFNYSKL